MIFLLTSQLIICIVNINHLTHCNSAATQSHDWAAIPLHFAAVKALRINIILNLPGQRYDAHNWTRSLRFLFVAKKSLSFVTGCEKDWRPQLLSY